MKRVNLDPAQHVTVGDVPLQAEAIEQRLLHHPPLAHHRPNPSCKEERISAEPSNQAEFINIG
jgi:hypothetical protein